MFGYVMPDTPYMYVKDGVLYKALYCGLCKSIGASCGQTARFSISYDITFLSALLHNIAGVDVKIEKEHCVLHPIVKREITRDDDITRALACLNVYLTYYKLSDDIEDEKKGRATRAFFKKGRKKARKIHPAMEEIIRTHLNDLHKLEKKNCESAEMAADPFGLMMAELSDYVLGDKATEHTYGLCYGIGKWVYLIDALDDYDKDIKKKNYNPFYAAYACPTRAELLEKNGEEIDFIFRSVFALNREHLAGIQFHFNHDLTDNIILRGLPAATKRVLCGCKKRKNTQTIRL